MIQLIILGVLALGSMFGIYTWKQSIFKEGAQKQLIADAKILDVCVQDKNTAVSANKDLKASFDLAMIDVQKANQGLDDLKKRSDEAMKEKARRLALADSMIEILKKDREIALASSLLKPTGTCIERLSNITNELYNISQREFKDRAPTKPDMSTKPDIPSVKKDNKDTLRVK